MKIAIYPGSFDPITNGHLDIINRASTIFDKVYVVVSENVGKETLFSAQERVEMIKAVTSDFDNVEADATKQLSVTYAKEKGAKFIVRGLRATLDFEYELNIFAINKHIDKDNEIDTIFFMTRLENSFISSSGIKEMVMYDVSVKELVQPYVEQMLIEKFKKKDDESCI